MSRTHKNRTHKNRTRKNRKYKKKGGNEISDESFQQVGKLLYQQEQPLHQQEEPFQYNHMFVGYRNNTEREPIIIPKNIQFKGSFFSNDEIDKYVYGIHIQLILPYIYQINTLKNLYLFDRHGYYDNKWKFIETTKNDANANKIIKGAIHRISFTDENDKVILPSMQFVANGTTEEQYINQFRQQIDEVMEKYPGLFAPIN
jgi:hypothetical protein